MKYQDIDVTFTTEKELLPEEQIHHEQYISFFKDHLQKWLYQKGIARNFYLHLNVEYFPELYKFRISHISHQETHIIDRLRSDVSF